MTTAAIRRTLGLASAAVAALVLGGCGRVRPDPVTEQGRAFRDMFPVFVWLGIGVAGLIWVLTIWSVVRYRRRADADGLPSQRGENLRLEAVYTVVPVLIVAGLFALSVANEGDVTDITDDPDVRVEVIGFQWQWQFRYPDLDVVVSGSTDRPPLLVLPEGRTAQLHLVTTDVIHSFWVPEFLSKRDLVPEIDNTIDVTPTDTGSWLGRCAEYCGLDHWRMYFEAHVVPGDVFDEWVAAARGADPTDVPRPEGVETP